MVGFVIVIFLLLLIQFVFRRYSCDTCLKCQTEHTNKQYSHADDKSKHVNIEEEESGSDLSDEDFDF